MKNLLKNLTKEMKNVMAENMQKLLISMKKHGIMLKMQ